MSVPVQTDAFTFLEILGYKISEDGDGPDVFMVAQPGTYDYCEVDVQGIMDIAEDLGWENPHRKPVDPELDLIIRRFLGMPESGPSNTKEEEV